MEKEYEKMQYSIHYRMFEELKAFYDFKREQEKPPTQIAEGWSITEGMFEVVFELLAAKMEGREMRQFPLGELHTTKQACSMLLNFSYACDYLTTGFVTFGRCPDRERRWYEYPLEQLIEMIDEEAKRVAEIMEAHQTPHENG